MRLLFLSLVFLSSLIFGDTTLSLKGYISYEDLSGVQQILNVVRTKQSSTLVIALSSSSGSLEDTFDIAQQISNLKESITLKVIVFIDNRAIGPAAIIPLLADELYVTPDCVWGDMTYNIDPFVSIDVLRTEVMSLLPSESKKQQIAQAMMDPSVQIAGFNDQGGGPLILRTEQMSKLGLISSILTEEQFQDKYPSLQSNMQSVLTPTNLRHQMEEYIRVYPVGVNLVGYLSIGDKEPITEKTYFYVKYALEEYVKKSVSCILLHLDSPGGELLSAIKISTLLQNVDLVHNIPVIGFINTEAVSAAALIAYSCRFIGTNSLGQMGAYQSEFKISDGSMTQAKDKVIKVLRSEIGSLASFYGRNPLIAEAMVDPEMVLILRNGVVFELKPNQLIERNDQILSDRMSLLTLNGEQLFQLGVAEFILQPEVLKEVTPEQLELGRWPAAYELAFQQPFLKGIPNAQIYSFSSWKIGFYHFATQTLVFSFLIIGFLLCMYIQMHTQGFKFYGVFSLTCLAILISLNFELHTVGWFEMIVLISGVLCLVFEMFLASRLGAIGIIGITLTLLGLLSIMMPGFGVIELLNLDSVVLFFNQIAYRTICFILAIMLTLAGIIALSTLKPNRFRSLKQIFSRNEEEEFSLTSLPKAGDTGQADTALSPEGKVKVGNVLYLAFAEDGFIEKGKQVVVVRLEGNKIFVKNAENI
jgi:membrane-bound serine protease (ClpP class)